MLLGLHLFWLWSDNQWESYFSLSLWIDLIIIIVCLKWDRPYHKINSAAPVKHKQTTLCCDQWGARGATLQLYHWEKSRGPRSVWMGGLTKRPVSHQQPMTVISYNLDPVVLVSWAEEILAREAAEQKALATRSGSFWKALTKRHRRFYTLVENNQGLKYSA